MTPPILNLSLRYTCERITVFLYVHHRLLTLSRMWSWVTYIQAAVQRMEGLIFKFAHSRLGSLFFACACVRILNVLCNKPYLLLCLEGGIWKLSHLAGRFIPISLSYHVGLGLHVCRCFVRNKPISVNLLHRYDHTSLPTLTTFPCRPCSVRRRCYSCCWCSLHHVVSCQVIKYAPRCRCMPCWGMYDDRYLFAFYLSSVWSLVIIKISKTP